jgi:hypothetical protein
MSIGNEALTLISKVIKILEAIENKDEDLIDALHLLESAIDKLSKGST